MVGQLQAVFHCTALNLYYRFILPLVTVEDETGEHLLSGKSFVTALAVEFLCEVEREGLHGADAVVIVDEQRSELRCGGGGQGYG